LISCVNGRIEACFKLAKTATLKVERRIIASRAQPAAIRTNWKSSGYDLAIVALSVDKVVSLTKMDIDRYLARINDDGPVGPSLETLRRLHYAHLLSVPFENLDIHLKRPIVLDLDLVYTKVVEKRRGGYCYELNGLFAQLLHEIGFEVSMLSARVANEQGGFSPEFDHMALLVRLNQSWLADVGFGSCFLYPVIVDEAARSEDATGTYTITRGYDGHALNRASEDGELNPIYKFTLEPHSLAEYDAMSTYHQTSPDSWFTKRRVCTRATTQGRITLSDMKLIVDDRGARTESVLGSEEEYRAALARYFDIVL
jgi:N-hydroxyarylamine O-acetyltransferase